MKSTAEAVIIGGGVMGCSTLYNLANLGMKDTVLVERDVLGSGSTGRSQAILRMHYSNPITSSMAWESLKIFKDFENLVGVKLWGFIFVFIWFPAKLIERKFDQLGSSARKPVLTPIPNCC
ncbi:FAD-binding oxidoreductase [SAR202 cluster bacterium AD-804-J14_MRT_500m]|nr:FAD-binding oxidoreductase [SAR202 cluster bacterium AD-804-J14_MRT_500m]